MTTLITDEFSEPEFNHNYAPHNIVYGANGWTDEIDDDTVALLASIGVIELSRTHYGVDWQTNIYVSKKGKLK